jgi:hypothetical protein
VRAVGKNWAAQCSEEHNVLIVGVEYHRMLEGATPDCRDTEEEPVLLVQ